MVVRPRPPPVQLDRVNAPAAGGPEPAEQGAVTLGAEARVIPRRMVQDDERVGNTIQLREQVSQQTVGGGLGVAGEALHDSARLAGREIVHAKVEAAGADRDGPLGRDGRAGGRLEHPQVAAGVDRIVVRQRHQRCRRARSRCVGARSW
ncbi:MAG: hypothetical protein MZV64_14015 [Ignavibacteriales bacterium]|nr:hypothetical protein [Ignavibacteriales bacterium]